MGKIIEQDNDSMMNLAKAVASEIAKDGVCKNFLEAIETDRVDFVLAYADDVIRKMGKLKTLYLTNDDFKKQFRGLVFEMFTKK